MASTIPTLPMPTTTPKPTPATTDIDALLQRYLTLLDEYTLLRSRLSALHASVYQHLAKANFSAERGIRYGQDYYDERMSASRRLGVSVSGSGDRSGGAAFQLVRSEATQTEAEAGASGEGGTAGEEEEGKATGGEGGRAVGGSDDFDSDDGDGEDPHRKTPKKKANDPLRWFGILTPLSLRQAQAVSIESVEGVIPRLAAVSSEMAGIELEVRRARKRRAKASAAAEKERMNHQGGQTETPGVREVPL
jgi:coiled-coil domain-containing protein 115